VLFPAWVQLGPTRSAGIEAIGANMLTVFGSMLAHFLLLVLPGLLGAASYYALVVVFSPGAELRATSWPGVPAAIAFSACAFAELWLIVHWLGGVLTRTDPAAVDAALA
jgi:hypothetical protein